ncbi:hypothetical protein Bbelb_231110 [Branchiostoma belcheri]|nr:hypothetical protein Bbelb_231110 [Branchiostoma belcheri]
MPDHNSNCKQSVEKDLSVDKPQSVPEETEEPPQSSLTRRKSSSTRRKSVHKLLTALQDLSGTLTQKFKPECRVATPEARTLRVVEEEHTPVDRAMSTPSSGYHSRNELHWDLADKPPVMELGGWELCDERAEACYY